MDDITIISRLKLAASMIDEITISLEGRTHKPDPEPVQTLWEMFVTVLSKHMSVPHEIKPALLAQALIETGRGTSTLFKAYLNPAGMKWRDEMKGYAIPMKVSVTSETTGYGVFCAFNSIDAAITGWIQFLSRSPYSGWQNYVMPSSFLRFVCPIWAADPDYLKKCQAALKEATILLENAGWESSYPPATTGRLIGKKILLDPGHSKSAQGASGTGSTPPSEYAMNALQAKIVYDILTKEGAECEIYDPTPDNLVAVGQKAKGKDLFVALHHNAYNKDGVDEGTETYVPRAAGNACRILARAINDAIVSELGTKNRGVKEMDYTVIKTALAYGCPLSMLVESYFIDDYSSVATTIDRSTRAANAIANAIIKEL